MKKLKIIVLLLLSTYNLFSQNLIDEDFNANTMPTGWTSYTTSGTQLWQVGLTHTVNGNNLTGSLAFDDDAAGDTGVRNLAGVSSPTFNIASYLSDPNLVLSFVLGYGFDTVDSDDVFRVVLWNATNGVTKEIFQRNTTSFANYSQNSIFNSTEIADFQDDLKLIIFFDDVNASWGWSAKVDFIRLFIMPKNNFMNSAINLPVGNSFNEQVYLANNFGATNNTNNNPTMSCSGALKKDIWFKSTIPNSGNLIVETGQVTGSIVDDTVLAIYSGVWGNLTEIACNDDIGGVTLFSKIELTAQAPGEEIFVRVISYDDLTYGEFKIATYDTSPPYNNCTAPLPITVGTTFNDSFQVLDNTDNTSSGVMPLPSCIASNLSAKPDVWLQVIVPTSGNLTLETLDNADANISYASITVYNDTCNNLTEIACSDLGSTINSNFTKLELTNLTPGDSLLVRIIAFGTQFSQGTFKVAAYNDATANVDVNIFYNLKLYPNPIEDFLNIDTLEKITEIIIYNQIGQRIKTILPLQNKVKINLSNLTKGFYFIKIKSNNNTIIKQIIKK